MRAPFPRPETCRDAIANAVLFASLFGGLQQHPARGQVVGARGQDRRLLGMDRLPATIRTRPDQPSGPSRLRPSGRLRTSGRADPRRYGRLPRLRQSAVRSARSPVPWDTDRQHGRRDAQRSPRAPSRNTRRAAPQRSAHGGRGGRHSRAIRAVSSRPRPRVQRESPNDRAGHSPGDVAARLKLDGAAVAPGGDGIGDGVGGGRGERDVVGHVSTRPASSRSG